MKILGINSSPRQNGNSHYMMDLFMNEMKQFDHDIQVLDATRMNIKRCIGCGNCEKKGQCVFKDDFSQVFLPAVISADIMVISSPVYFYAFPADVKALIDRIQVLWSQKYILKTQSFENRERRGVLLAVAATSGRDLFAGMEQTARYFFDAAGIEYTAALCYRGIDQKGEIKEHPTVHEDIKKLVQELCA